MEDAIASGDFFFGCALSHQNIINSFFSGRRWGKHFSVHYFLHSFSMKVTTKFPRQHGCCMCHKYFTSRFELKRHSNIHTGENSYPCNVCDKRFHTKDARNRHLSVHSDAKHFSCELCHCSFKLKEQLRAHGNTKKHLQRAAEQAAALDLDDGHDNQQQRIQDAIRLLEENNFNIVRQ